MHTFTSLHYIIQYICVHFTSSFLLLCVAGWLLSTHCVRYSNDASSIFGAFHINLRMIDDRVHSSPIFLFLGWRSSKKRCKGCQYFSGILRISENDWQLILWFSENVLQQHQHASKKLAVQEKFICEQRIQLSILLGDFTNLWEEYGMKRINT